MEFQSCVFVTVNAEMVTLLMEINTVDGYSAFFRYPAKE
jgi:hypothetical protein